MNSKRLAKKGRRGGWGTVRISKSNINRMAKAKKKEEEKKRRRKKRKRKKGGRGER